MRVSNAECGILNFICLQATHPAILRFRIPHSSFRISSGAGGETRTPVGLCPAVYKTAAVAAEPHRRIDLGCGLENLAPWILSD